MVAIYNCIDLDCRHGFLLLRRQKVGIRDFLAGENGAREKLKPEEKAHCTDKWSRSKLEGKKGIRFKLGDSLFGSRNLWLPGTRVLWKRIKFLWLPRIGIFFICFNFMLSAIPYVRVYYYFKKFAEVPLLAVSSIAFWPLPFFKLSKENLPETPAKKGKKETEKATVCSSYQIRCCKVGSRLW